MEKRTIGIPNIVVFIVLLMPLFVYLPHLSSFAYPASSEYSDLTISHYPNALIVHRSLQTWGEIPLWSRNILSGYPFYANPLAGIWYPPGWLPNILPSTISFNISILLHLFWAGLGMYLLLRRQGNDRIPSLIGALIFEILPKTHAHFAAGHVTLIYAISWTPWLLLVVDNSLKINKRWMYAGSILGIIFLADGRWAACAFLLYLVMAARGTLSIDVQTPNLRRFMNFLKQSIAVFFVMFLVAAVLIIPLVEYSSLSTRSKMTLEDNLAFSLPPAHLLGMVFPDFEGYAEWIVYPGAMVTLFVSIFLLLPTQRRMDRFWLSIFFASLLLSMAGYFPLLRDLWRLPGFSLLRVPSRFMIINGIAGAILVCHFLQRMMKEPLQLLSDRFWNVVRIHLVAVSVLLLLFALGYAWLTKGINIEFLWGALAFLFVSILVFIFINKKTLPQYMAIFLIPFVIVDLGFTAASQSRFVPWQDAMSTRQDLVDFIAIQSREEISRIYSPSYSIEQQIGAYYDLELADGIDPLQLSAYVNFMLTASGVPNQGYSVTLPPFSTGNPKVDNQGYTPDAELLGLLNVHFIVSQFPIETNELRLEYQSENGYIYSNPRVRSRVWVDKSDMGNDDESNIIASGQSKVVVVGEGPGQLVLADIYYPGWTATVDGSTASIIPYENLLMSVNLTAGKHVVEFTFSPVTGRMGLVISGISCLGLSINLIKELRKKHVRSH